MKSPHRLALVRPALFAGSLFTIALPSIHASLPAYDGIEYTVGDAILGSTDADGNGGTGWVNRWTGNNTTVTVGTSATTITKTIDDFTYGSGNSLSLSGTTSTNAAQRLFASPELSTGADIYVSFLVQYTGATGVVPSGPFIGVGLLDSANSTSVDNYVILNSANGAVGARVNNITTNIATGTFQLSYNTTALVVGLFSGWNGTNYTSTTVWVNPTSDDFGNTSISATSTSVTGSSGAGGLIIRTNTLGSTTVLFDDIRVGTTWDSVVLSSVPEPSTYALLVGAAGLLTCAASRRRSRL